MNPAYSSDAVRYDVVVNGGALATWLRLEITEGWRTWWSSPAAQNGAPTPVGAAAPATE